MAENMEGKNLDEKLKNSLRKMIRSCDNYIKEARNLEQLEDNLKHMEETDENFHKSEFIANNNIVLINPLTFFYIDMS